MWLLAWLAAVQQLKCKRFLGFSQVISCTADQTTVTCDSTEAGVLTRSYVEASGAFSRMTKVIVQGKITEIASRCFASCSSLVEAVVTAPVKIYNYGVFDGCKLRTFTFGKDATQISGEVFNNVPTLQSINVNSENPNYCAENGLLMTKDRKTLVIIPGSLKSIEIPSTVNTLGTSCNVWGSLESVTIPDHVVSINTNAFYQNILLTYVWIGSGVTYIDNAAFKACQALQKVEVSPSNSVYDSINGVLGKLSNGKKVSIIHISWDTTEVTLTSSITEIGSMVFSNARSLVLIRNEAGTTENKYFSPDGAIVMIGTTVINGAGGAKSIVIPETATEIVDSAFRYMHNLTSVTFTNNVIWTKNAFRDCHSLSVINWGNFKPLSCPSHVFVGIAVENLILPSSIQTLEEYAFAASSIRTVSCPGVETVEQLVFSGCGQLESVSFGSVKTIGYGALRDCVCLREVTFGDRLESLGNSALRECLSLQEIELPGSVTYIDRESFSGDTELRVIKIADSNTVYSSYGGGVYRIVDNVKYHTLFFCAEGAVDISILAHEISQEACYACSKLASVSMSNVETIGNSAFAFCTSLESITLPDSVTSIGSDVFLGCSNVTSVFYCGTTGIPGYTETSLPSNIGSVFVKKDFKQSSLCDREVTRILDDSCIIPTHEFSIDDHEMHANADILSLIVESLCYTIMY